VVTPATRTVVTGETVTYHATAYDAFSNSWDVTASAAFSVDPGAGGSWAANVYTSEVVGDWIVTGQYLALSDTADLTVEAEPPAAILYLPLLMVNNPVLPGMTH
jgi:hypothetical protein